MKNLTEKELCAQNSLTKERLKKFLTPKFKEFKNAERPSSSLIELINWVKRSFLHELLHEGNDLQAYIHNKISIDGQFLQFCEENDVNVECLLKDSIASWNGEHDDERFIAQGIFKIVKGDLEFYNCALFHKGNQNDDEVSFFVLVSNEMFEKYIEFRNGYEKWKIEREKNTNEIYVVGGDPISYETNLDWNDLIIPGDILNEIKISIDGFLKSEKFYKEKNIPWKRAMIFWGDPGNGKTLAIKLIISAYGFKPVTIQPGSPNKDQLLEEAFEYAESHGPSLLFLEDFPELLASVNESHFLQLLDGFSSKEGLFVIATANDLSKVPHNLTDRPSRFDRKIKFPAPSKETAKIFLKQKFGNKITDAQYTKIAGKCVSNNFSFAYLKELYITAVHISLSENRTVQTLADVEKALDILSKDRTYVQRGFDYKKPIDIETMF